MLKSDDKLEELFIACQAESVLIYLLIKEPLSIY